MAEGREHSADLAVAAFEDRQLDYRLPCPIRALPFAVALVAAAETDILGRLGRAVFEVDPPAQDVQRFLGRNAAHLRPIGLWDMVARVGQTVQKLAVVGQEDQAFRVNVQSPDRAEHRLIAQIHQVRDKLGRMRILQRRHHPARLIQCDIIPLTRKLDRAAIEEDPVGIQVHFRAKLRDDLSINFDPTLEDPRFAGSARADPGGGERFLKPF